MSQEPQSKRDSGKAMCPNWVRGEMAKLLNELDGTYDEVMVGAVALLGENGYDFKCCEQTTNFDPAEYGQIMLEGYSMIAGGALAKVLDTVHAATQNPEHFTQDIEDEEERFQQLRNLYEQAIRQFLRSMLTYAGPEFQRDKPGGMSVAAGSQLIGLWQNISTSTIKFQNRDAENPEHPEVNDGES